jgi:hypothetical protein
MPKVDIDYSNTIFYKIFCKDSSITDLYVGLTTNFVQRRHSHKQSCKNEKATNHNCKLYNNIRNAGGWDNWQMEIIAFHNCADSYEARKKEQEYFEKLGATLNSIDPFPKPKITEPSVKIETEKTNLFCEPCKVYFSNWKARDVHNDTKKHHKMELLSTALSQKIPLKFACEVCHYSTCNKKDYNKHLLTDKHKKQHITTVFTNKSQEIPNISVCECGKVYKGRSGLWRHKQKCTLKPLSESDKENTKKAEPTDKDLIMLLIKENSELKNMMMKVLENGTMQNNHTTTNKAVGPSGFKSVTNII